MTNACFIQLDEYATYEDWYPYARYCLHHHIVPSDVHWQNDNIDDLFCNDSNSQQLTIEQAQNFKPGNSNQIRVNRNFVILARYSCCFLHPDRFAVMYRILWRVVHEDNLLLADITDPDIHLANRWAKAVGRDRHKMKAFVRFKEIKFANEDPHYVAWFEPEHAIVKLTSDFFRDRFYGMDWSILTPYLCVHWVKGTLTFTQGCDKSQAPQEDALEDLWRTYYLNIFNPARLKVKAMCAEMPKKYWHNLPESSLIDPLIKQAERAKQAMIEKKPTDPLLPSKTKFDREKWINSK
ncbi:MAG: TIGR03915 family putative DNA repair protein [Pseudomonadales bacterium]|nr:TIGR03915 family putative DNA repair protein [Pseudomonadales bacterium]